MSTGKSQLKYRIDTIRTLVEGSPVAAHSYGTSEIIKSEFQQTYLVFKLSHQKRKHILMILHSTRALDSMLKYTLTAGGHPITGHSLGSYLHDLKSVGVITEAERNRFQNGIVKKRNNYMHSAGEYPKNDNEVFEIILKMHDLIFKVI